MQEEVASTRPVRRAMLLAGVLSGVVSLSLMGLPLRADERWYPYLFGPARLREPWTVVSWPLSMVDGYLAVGNFRPLGRMVEHANYLLDHLLAVLTGLPMGAVLGLVRALSVAALGAATVWLTGRLLGSTSDDVSGRRLLTLVAVTYPVLIVAAGNGSSVVIFSGLYFQSTVLTVLAAGAFAWSQLYTPGGIGVRHVVGFGLLGAVLAATNELTYLVVPAAAAVVAVTLRRTGARPSDLRRLPIVGAIASAGVGFTLVFVPARVAIARACDRAACYANSAVDVDGWNAGLWLSRALSGLPAPAWWWERYLLRQPPLRSLLAALLVVAVVVGLWTTLRSRRWRDGASLSDARPDAVRLIVVGAVIVLAAAMLSSLSTQVQAGMNPLAGWRESPVSFVGWALVLAGIGHLLTVDGRLRHARIGVVASGLAAALALTVTSNAAKPVRDARDPRIVLTDRIATHVATFGDDETQRCALLLEFAELHPERPDQHRLLSRALDATTEARYGRAFCEGQ